MVQLDIAINMKLIFKLPANITIGNEDKLTCMAQSIGHIGESHLDSEDWISYTEWLLLYFAGN